MNALELKALISGERVLAPPTLIQKYPELKKIADPEEDSGTTKSRPQVSITPLRFS